MPPAHNKPGQIAARRAIRENQSMLAQPIKWVKVSYLRVNKIKSDPCGCAA